MFDPHGPEFHCTLTGRPAFIAEAAMVQTAVPAVVRAAAVGILALCARSDDVVLRVVGSRGGPSDSDPLCQRRTRVTIELEVADPIPRPEQGESFHAALMRGVRRD